MRTSTSFPTNMRDIQKGSFVCEYCFCSTGDEMMCIHCILWLADKVPMSERFHKCLIMFKKIKIHTICEMKSVVHFLNVRNIEPIEIQSYLRDFWTTCNDLIQWFRERCDILMNGIKMCMMINGAWDHL